MIREIFELGGKGYRMVASGIFDLDPADKIQPMTVESLKKARGEFVGCEYNNGELTLIRDRIGARNLYYLLRRNTIFVSTDILWIIQENLDSIGIDYILNTDYIAGDYLQFQIPFGNQTIYRGIRKVMPGSVVTFDRITDHAYKPVEKKYWTLKFNENGFDKYHLRDLIVDAVEFRKRLLEKPYTSYLSGGIDSSTITSILDPSECYSGIYSEEMFSELDYIYELPKIQRLKVNQILITETRFMQFLTNLPMVMPDPCGGLGVIPQLIVAMEAFKGGYFYSFTGEGGDEIFYGYPWNRLITKISRFIRELHDDKYMVRWDGMIDSYLKNDIVSSVATRIGKGGDKEYQIARISGVWDNTQPVENNIMRINVLVGLPAILTVDERVGIYSSVMPVSPLCDHNIVEYVASINPEDRTRIPKYLLREATRGILPEKIRTRFDKMGFPVPYEKWDCGSVVVPLLLSLQKRGMEIDPREYKTLDRKTWALVNIELIYRMLEQKLYKEGE